MMFYELKCPHCQQVNNLEAEDCRYNDGEDWEVVCSKCEEKIYAKTLVSIDFYTYKTEEDREND